MNGVNPFTCCWRPCCSNDEQDGGFFKEKQKEIDGLPSVKSEKFEAQSAKPTQWANQNIEQRQKYETDLTIKQDS